MNIKLNFEKKLFVHNLAMWLGASEKKKYTLVLYCIFYFIFRTHLAAVFLACQRHI